MTTFTTQPDVWNSCPGHGHALLASLGSGAVAVDYFRTASGASYAAHILNIGAAHLDRHRPIGTRVQPGAPMNARTRSPRAPIRTATRTLSAIMAERGGRALLTGNDEPRLADESAWDDRSHVERASYGRVGSL